MPSAAMRVSGEEKTMSPGGMNNTMPCLSRVLQSPSFTFATALSPVVTPRQRPPLEFP